MSPWRNAALCISAAVAGTTVVGAGAFKWLLRRMVMGAGRATGSAIERTIILNADGGVEIIDEGELPAGARTVVIGARLDTMYGESARYYVPSQLTASVDELDVGDVTVAGGRFRIHRIVRPGASGTILSNLVSERKMDRQS
jgi:hypothetical protein